MRIGLGHFGRRHVWGRGCRSPSEQTVMLQHGLNTGFVVIASDGIDVSLTEVHEQILADLDSVADPLRDQRLRDEPPLRRRPHDDVEGQGAAGQPPPRLRVQHPLQPGDHRRPDFGDRGAERGPAPAALLPGQGPSEQIWNVAVPDPGSWTTPCASPWGRSPSRRSSSWGSWAGPICG